MDKPNKNYKLFWKLNSSFTSFILSLATENVSQHTSHFVDKLIRVFYLFFVCFFFFLPKISPFKKSLQGIATEITKKAKAKFIVFLAIPPTLKG